MESWDDTPLRTSGRKAGGQSWSAVEVSKQLQDAESRLRKYLDGGRNTFRNEGFGEDFGSAQLLADAVRRDLADATPSARVVNPLRLALIDSGASAT